MYEQRFGTDWQSLSSDEALFRMFALGVSTALGEPHPEEFERLRALADTAYGRSVLELSFQEGKQRASADRRTVGSVDDDDAEEIWESLVESEAEPPAGSSDVPNHDPMDGSPGLTGVPDAVGRASFLELDSEDLDRLSIPDMLMRDT